jgi:hypothetical protein
MIASLVLGSTKFLLLLKSNVCALIRFHEIPVFDVPLATLRPGESCEKTGQTATHNATDRRTLGALSNYQNYFSCIRHKLAI